MAKTIHTHPRTHKNIIFPSLCLHPHTVWCGHVAMFSTRESEQGVPLSYTEHSRDDAGQFLKDSMEQKQPCSDPSMEYMPWTVLCEQQINVCCICVIVF